MRRLRYSYRSGPRVKMRYEYNILKRWMHCLSLLSTICVINVSGTSERYGNECVRTNRTRTKTVVLLNNRGYTLNAPGETSRV